MEDRKQQLLDELKSLEIRASNSDKIQELFNKAFRLWLETGDNKWFAQYQEEHIKHPQLM